ncbi:MAG: DNA methyltransferase [Pseudomonadota bacterium]|nr:DNA methyltransferase [Pseudomonadota bacterium]
MKRTYINQAQAALELGIDRSTVAHLLSQRLIVGARKVGGRWLIPTPVQRKVGTRGFKSKQAEQREAFLQGLPEVADVYKLHCCPVADLSQRLEPDSIDYIITDPPYGQEAIPVYADLGSLAKVVLKPGGSLVVMTGQSYLPEVMQNLAAHLTYQWMLPYLTPGGQAPQIWERKVNSFWKPVLWYVKGAYEGKWAGDVVKSAVNDNDKRFHRWGQSESGMADIIDRFTEPGQTILDPFLGGGTTAVVALGMRRKFIGADSDSEAIKTTLQRLQNG